MSERAARRGDPAPGCCDPVSLEHGLKLLEAQRKAIIDGDLGRLADANAAIDAWVAGMIAVSVGRNEASLPISDRNATRMRGTLRANAAAAQRASSGAQRALTALIPVAVRTYDADGRTSPSTATRTSVHA